MSFSNAMWKVVMLGDSGVGKTSIMRKFIYNRFDKHQKSTIGADFGIIDVITDKVRTDIALWDTAGQERFESLGTAFFRGSDFCVLVYDISNYKSFENIEKWKMGYIEQNSGYIQYPMLLLGNKLDLVSDNTDFDLYTKDQQILAITSYFRLNFNNYVVYDIITLCLKYASVNDGQRKKRMTSYKKAVEYAIKNNMVFYEVSALNGMHLVDAFEGIILKIKETNNNPFCLDNVTNENVDFESSSKDFDSSYSCNC
eukprot:34834_1